MVYKIGVIGDTHFGSPDAIATPEYYIGNDERRSCRVSANDVQKFLYSQLEDTVDEMGMLDLLLLVGDTCDGDDGKNRGKSVLCTDLDAQVNMAVEGLSIIKTRKIVSVSGSPYHNGNNLTTDHNVCTQLGNRLKVEATHGLEKWIKAGDIMIHVRHETSFHKKPEHRPTGLINEIKEFTGDGFYVPGSNMPNLLIRGHTHYMEEVETRGIRAIINPCWKWRDDFISKKSVMTPDLGNLYIEVDGSYYEPWINTFKIPSDLDMSGTPITL